MTPKSDCYVCGAPMILGDTQDFDGDFRFVAFYSCSSCDAVAEVYYDPDHS